MDIDLVLFPLFQETVAMTEELRMRLRYLRHLPVTCNFDVVEVTLRTPHVSKATITLFQVCVHGPYEAPCCSKLIARKKKHFNNF